MNDGISTLLDWNWSPSQWAAAQARYDRQIIEQHGRIRIFGQTTPKPLATIFTDVYVLEKPTAHMRASPDDITELPLKRGRSLSPRQEQRKPAEEILGTGTRFILLGKPGAGKTTLLRYLALREARPGQTGRLGKLPIFVSLRQYANARKPLFDFIAEQFAVCRFPDAAAYVGALLESGSALLLFDGLDEVMSSAETQPHQRGQIAEELEQFALRYSDCHVLISYRIAATSYTFHSSFTYLELADFSLEQVTHFVRHWFADEANPEEGVAIADRMVYELALPEHEGIRDLARNPLLLTLLCLNYAAAGRFPIRRADVYDEALDALMKVWDDTRQIGRDTRYKQLSLGRKKQMFAKIAYEAFIRGMILFEQSELEAAILACLKDAPGLPESIDIDASAVLNEIIAQHGIFAQQAHRLYSFPHLTFQEYYTARFIVDDATGSAQATLLEHVASDRWREVALMVVSLLPDGSRFLEDYATDLQKTVTSSQTLATALRQLDHMAGRFAYRYRRSAVRLLGYAIVLLRNTRDLGSIRAGDTYLHLFDIRTAAHSRRSGWKTMQNLYEIAYDTARELDPEIDRDIRLAAENSPRFAPAPPIWMQALALAVEQFRTANDSYFNYMRAVRLFYDCIQLANVPDRRVFEDRILEPPP